MTCLLGVIVNALKWNSYAGDITIMEDKVRKWIENAVSEEPFAKTLGMRLLDLDNGFSKVEVMFDPEKTDNIYGRAHGGVIYALIDEAFEAASQTEGVIAVALNVNVSYIKSPEKGLRLTAEAKRKSLTRKTAVYDITVMDENGALIAICNAVAYVTGKPVPIP